MTTPTRTTPGAGSGGAGTDGSAQGLGLWHDPDAEYLLGLGRSGSIAAIIGLFAVFVAFIPPEGKLLRVLIVAAIVAAVVGPFTLRDRWDRNLYDRLIDQAKWQYHRYSGRALYSNRWWLSADSIEQTHLPGLLNQVSITQHPLHPNPTNHNNHHHDDDEIDDGFDPHNLDDKYEAGKGDGLDHGYQISEDSQGLAFAVVHYPKANTASVVLACQPAGAGLADGDTIAAQARAWERWLAAMADEPDLAGIQVVTEAAPTLRTPACQHLQDLTDVAGSDPLATKVLGDVVEACTGRVGTRTWVTVSWSPTSGRARNRFGGPDLAARVERLCTSLTETGAGTVQPLDRQALAAVWAGMYNPARREHLSTGNTRISPQGAGPVTHLERRDRYCVDNIDAISLTMGIAPDTTVTPAVHERLAAGIDGALAARWALLLRPVDALEARTWSRTMRNAVETRLAFTGDRRPSAHDLVADEDTTATATALARGRTALTRCAFAITLTLPADTDPAGPIERTRAAVAPLSPHLRIMHGAQQTTWVASLPGSLPIPLAQGLTQ